MRKTQNKRFKFLSFGAFLAFAAATGLFLEAGTAFGKVVDEVALVVNQAAMTKGEMEEAVAGYYLAQQIKPPKAGTPEFEKTKQEVVESFIREVLLSEQADKDNIEIPENEITREVDRQVEGMKKSYPSEQDFLEGLKKEGLNLDELRSEITDKFLRRLKASRVLRLKQQEPARNMVVTDGEIKQYYEKNPDAFEKVKFSIILFRIPESKKNKASYVKEVQAQAQAVLKELKAGANFKSYAKKYSEDPGTADKGGEVGQVSRADLEPKLAKGLFAIPTGSMGLVKAAEGIYIVKVQYKGKSDFASSAGEIKDHLQKQKQQRSMDVWINSLKKDAYIVLDGKVMAYTPIRLKTEDGEEGTASSEESEKPGVEEGVASGVVSSSVTVTTPVSEQEVTYPTLPIPGSFAFYFGVDGFSYGTRDLANIYDSSVKTNQDFPFGFGLNLGLDWALDSTFLVGIKAEALRKTVENVTDALGNKYEWNAGAFAPLLSLRVMIPLDEGTNFTLSANGGYYLLMASGLVIKGPSDSQKVDLSGGNWGGKAGVGLEFLLDDHKNMSLNFGLDYQYLNFNPVEAKVNSGTLVPFPSTLANNDGSNAMLDFSGVHMGLSMRFYLDKDYDK
jgi:foldase protein PrsA